MSMSCVCISYTKQTFIPLISILPFYGVLTIGYGLPTYNKYGECTDKGSPLGRWMILNFSPHNEYTANIFVRATIGFLIGISMMSLLCVENSFYWYISLLMLIIGYPLIVNHINNEKL